MVSYYCAVVTLTNVTDKQTHRQTYRRTDTGPQPHIVFTHVARVKTK